MNFSLHMIRYYVGEVLLLFIDLRDECKDDDKEVVEKEGINMDKRS